jgi:predicted RNA binding protein YcfA (HicA-like mRNA interferase family)
VNQWPRTKAKHVLSALNRIGWLSKPNQKKGSSHIQLVHPTRGEYTWAFSDSPELGRVMLSKIAKATGLTSDDL